jgi:hypothetical protein
VPASMSKHPLLLNQLLHFLKPTEWGKVTDLQPGDLPCIHHHLEVADSTLNEVELALDPALSIWVAVAGSENLRVPLIRNRSLLGLVWQRELLIIGHHELLAHHLEGLHKVMSRLKLLDDWWHDSEQLLKSLSALLDHVQSANGVVVELRCLIAKLHLVFIVGLTVDGDLSVLHCQRFFLD